MPPMFDPAGSGYLPRLPKFRKQEMMNLIWFLSLAARWFTLRSAGRWSPWFVAAVPLITGCVWGLPRAAVDLNSRA